MSGGYLNSNEYSILSIVDSLNECLNDTDVDSICSFLSKDVIYKIRTTIKSLFIIYDKVKVIDYILSGDISDDIFKERFIEIEHRENSKEEN